MALASVILLVLLAVCFSIHKLVIFFHSKRKSKDLKPLPGPQGYPIIGVVPDIPEQNGHIKFADWGKQYGPIYQCNIAGTNHVWISSDQVARDLLSKKGAIYSDRPHIPALLDDNRTSAQYLPLLSKNDAWSRQRKFATQIMRESEKDAFYRYPELEAKRMLAELMNDPSQYNHVMESYISRVTCRLAWGRPEASDELKQRARELLIGVSPTGALGNKLPFLMGLPDWLSPAKAWERRRAQSERRWFQVMQGQVADEIRYKVARPSWMRTFLMSPEQTNLLSHLEGAYAVGMHGIAGALTIAAPMQVFCLAMVHYPQYLPFLHEELDRVCGDRLPTAEDRPYLPFLRAVIRECFRWRPPVPTGIPHEVTQDDEYDGYFIPKGSVLHPLEWAISRDPALYPDPEAFNPLRWLDARYPTYKEPLTQYPTIINSTQFGYGRRVCTGQQVADEDLLVGIGSLAWLFNISKEHEPVETPRTPSLASDSGYESDYSFEQSTSPPRIKSIRSRYVKTISQEELYTGFASLGKRLRETEEPSFPGSWPQEPRAWHHRVPSVPQIVHILRQGDVALKTRLSMQDINLETSELNQCLQAPPSAFSNPRSRQKYPLPASWQADSEPSPPATEKSEEKPKVDPTLDFSALLIAKPRPFKFSLTVRDHGRAAMVRRMYGELKWDGQFPQERDYWGGDHGKGMEFGWGKVWS